MLFFLLIFCLVPGGMPQGPLRIRFLHIISEIQSRFAITDVTSVVENTANYAQEVIFSAQLPEAAFISNFSMEIDFQIAVGEVRTTEAARQKYESDVRQGKSAGLVREVPRETNTFEIAVNVAAGKTITFVLTYQELLRRVQGAYKQIVNVQPRGPVDDIRVDVLIAEQGEINLLHVPKFAPRIAEKSNKELLALPEDQNVVVRSHIEKQGSLAYISYTSDSSVNRNVPVNGQLVVLYDVDRELDGGEIEVVNGYFIHFFAPDGFNAGNKHVVFVLDKSGSMQGQKFEQTKHAMKRILRDLNANDRFNVLMFSSEVQPWVPSSVPATRRNVEEAIRFVDNARAGGGTNIYDAVFLGMDMIDRDSTQPFASMVILLTDGQATVGRTDSAQIVRDVTNRNRRANYMINGLGFGADADFDLLQKVASQNGGLARKIYEDSDADLQLSGFYDQISSPLLRQLNIKYLNEAVDVNSLVQDEQLDYFEGGERVVAGKLNGNKKVDSLHAQVSAQGSRGQVSLQADAKPIGWQELGTRCIPVPRKDEWANMPSMIHFPAAACPHFNPQDDDPINPFRPERRPLPPDTAGGFIERMWAYLTIKKLLRQAKYEAGSEFERSTFRGEALGLSLKYNFVTELTSMVVSSDFIDANRRQGLQGDIKRGSGTNAAGGAKPQPAIGQGRRTRGPSGPAGESSSIAGIGRFVSGGSGSSGSSSGFPGQPSPQQPPPPPPSRPQPIRPPPPPAPAPAPFPSTTPSQIRPRPTSGCDVDIILVVDASMSLSQFYPAKSRILSFVQNLRFQNNLKTRNALVKLDHSDNPSVLLKLDQGKSFFAMNNALSRFRGRRRSSIGSSFADLVNELKNSPQKKRVLFYFAGQNEVGQVLEQAVRELRLDGVKTYSVLMDRQQATADTINIAGSPSRVLNDPKSTDLVNYVTC